MKLPKYV